MQNKAVGAVNRIGLAAARFAGATFFAVTLFGVTLGIGVLYGHGFRSVRLAQVWPNRDRAERQIATRGLPLVILPGFYGIVHRSGAFVQRRIRPENTSNNRLDPSLSRGQGGGAAQEQRRIAQIAIELGKARRDVQRLLDRIQDSPQSRHICT